MRPTNRAATSRRLLCPIWPCSGWGLHGRYVTIPPVSSYLTISTLPQHYLFRRNVSVALSLKLPSPDVIRHPCPMEPGLSSCRKACDCLTYPKHLILYHMLLNGSRFNVDGIISRLSPVFSLSFAVKFSMKNFSVP